MIIACKLRTASEKLSNKLRWVGNSARGKPGRVHILLSFSVCHLGGLVVSVDFAELLRHLATLRGATRTEPRTLLLTKT
jgi:hypothetical protein